MDVRTTLEIIVAAHLLGLVSLTATTDARVRGWEWIALFFWPVLLPLALAWNRYRRWRWTCRVCGGFYGDRMHYMLHTVGGTQCERRAGER